MNLVCSSCPSGATESLSNPGTCVCANGYYNIAAATATSVKCEAIPENSSSDPNNNYNFICYLNYIKTGNTCTACPKGAITTTASPLICECSSLYYVNATVTSSLACVLCPTG